MVNGIKKKMHIITVAFALVLAMNSIPYACAYPGAGIDVMDCTAILKLKMVATDGDGETLTVTGRIEIERNDPYNPDDDHMTIDTEIVAMSLTGTSSLLGPITVVESPTKLSTGAIRQQAISNDFPADSFFDVFIEIQTDGPYSTYHNDDPVRVSATIDRIPPFGAYPSGAATPLKDEGGNIVGSIERLVLGLGTEPTVPIVGGFRLHVDTSGLFAPYIALASTIVIATAVTAISVKRVKHRKETKER